MCRRVTHYQSVLAFTTQLLWLLLLLRIILSFVQTHKHADRLNTRHTVNIKVSSFITVTACVYAIYFPKDIKFQMMKIVYVWVCIE